LRHSQELHHAPPVVGVLLVVSAAYESRTLLLVTQDAQTVAAGQCSSFMSVVGDLCPQRTSSLEARARVPARVLRAAGSSQRLEVTPIIMPGVRVLTWLL
jgi:hypothetical protein